MNIIIIYDSLFGNTEQIAFAIKDGFKGHNITILRSEDVRNDVLGKVDLIIVGSPTHGGRPYQNTQSFLSMIPEHELKGKKAAAFDTGIPSEGQPVVTRFAVRLFGYAAKRIAAKLEQKGAKVIAKETFFVLGKEGPLKVGEIERARNWASDLLSLI